MNIFSIVKDVFSKGLVRDITNKPIPITPIVKVKKEISGKDIAEFTIQHRNWYERNGSVGPMNIYGNVYLKADGESVWLMEDKIKIGWLPRESGFSNFNYILFALTEGKKVKIVNIKRIMRRHNFYLIIKVRVPRIR